MNDLINILVNGLLIVVVIYAIYKTPWMIGKAAKAVVSAFKS